MKRVKPMLWATVLSLALSISAYGGDIQSPGVTGGNTGNQPPPATCNYCETSDEIQVQTSDATSSAETKSLETSEFAVDLLLALLALF